MSERRQGRPVYWTPERCIQAVEDFIQRVGRRPTYAEMKTANHLPSSMVFQQSVGYGMARYCREHEYLLPVSFKPPKETQKPKGLTWTPESIMKATDQFFQKYGRYPKTEEYCLRCGLPSHNTFKVHFGIAAGKYWRQRYVLPPEWTLEKALEAVRQFVGENARLPKSGELSEKNGLPTQKTLLQLSKTHGYHEFQEKYFPMLQPSKHRSWTREQCLQAVEQYVRKHGHVPAAGDQRAKNGLPPQETFKKYVGKSMTIYCKETFPDKKWPQNNRWDREKCISAVDQYFTEHKRYPRARDCCPENGLPSFDSFQKYTGQSLRDYCKERYPDLDCRGDLRAPKGYWDRDRCISAISQYIHQHGCCPRYKDFIRANGLPKYETFQKMVGQTPQAYCKDYFPEVFQAGDQGKRYAKSQDGRKSPWTRETCIQALEQYLSTHGEYPVYSHWNKLEELPSLHIFKRQTGRSPRQYLKESHPELVLCWGKKPKYWTAERCTQALERFLSTHGEFPSNALWKKENGLPTRKIFKQCVGKFPSQYMQEHDPNFCPNRGGRARWDEKRLCEAVEQFAALHGRLPKPHEFGGHNCLPTADTVKAVTGKTAARFLRERFPGQQVDAQTENQGMRMKGW